MHKQSFRMFHRARAWVTSSSRTRLISALVIVGLFAVLGFVLIQISGAATYSVALEAESGQRTGNATVETAPAGASGGQAVKFAAGAGNGNTGGNGEPADSIGYCPTDTTGNVTPPANAGLIWSDEFNGNSVSYAVDGGTWRTNGYEAGVGPGAGYNDFAASNRNVSAAESKKYGFATVNKGTLTLKAKRAVDVPGVFSDGKRWLGVYLVSDNNKNLTWRYGYFEWRMRDPVKTRGMFPTLFMFSNVPNRHDGYEGAEMDMIEIFGDARGYPWFAGVHFNPSKLNGKEGRNVATQDGPANETANWHRYSIEWTPTAVNYARDGKVIGSLNPDEVAWYTHADMGIRMNYSMDPKFGGDEIHTTENDPARGTTLCHQIDYVRVYSQKPANLPGGTGDPYQQ